MNLKQYLFYINKNDLSITLIILESGIHVTLYVIQTDNTTRVAVSSPGRTYISKVIDLLRIKDKGKENFLESCLVVLSYPVPRGNSRPDLILTTRLVSDSFAFDRRTIISADLRIQHRVSMDIKIQRRLLDLYTLYYFLAFQLYGIKCFLFYYLYLLVYKMGYWMQICIHVIL